MSYTTKAGSVNRNNHTNMNNSRNYITLWSNAVSAVGTAWYIELESSHCPVFRYPHTAFTTWERQMSPFSSHTIQREDQTWSRRSLRSRALAPALTLFRAPALQSSSLINRDSVAHWCHQPLTTVEVSLSDCLSEPGHHRALPLLTETVCQPADNLSTYTGGLYGEKWTQRKNRALDREL